MQLNVQSYAKVLMNMVVLGVGFVNPPSNQHVAGLDAYTVSMMNDHLSNKRLIPLEIPQAPHLHPG